MAQWNRFDICEAYKLLESDYNEGGLLQERPSNQRRNESIGVQLSRIGYSNPYGGGFGDAEDNVQEIYFARVLEWNLPIDEEYKKKMEEMFVPEYLLKHRPEIFGEKPKLGE